MTTKKLYFDNSYLHNFDATVLSCTKVADCYNIILDETAFFPEGGGQKADTGTIGESFVFDVQEKNGEIIHFSKTPLNEGETYNCSIDFETRFSRMQQHSGEHIVSGIVHSLYGYDNVGFHMEEEYVTVDFNGELTREQLDEVEEKSNEAIYKNYNIKCYFPDEKDLPNLDYRSKLDLTEGVRLVEIENTDLCACCAPHVSKTGEIGIIKILDFMRHRGGIRLVMKSGVCALRDYREKYKSVFEISNLLSAKQNEVIAAVERQKNQLEATDREFNSYKLSVAESAKDNIIYTEACAYYITKEFTNDMMRELANFGMEKKPLSLVFSGDDENGYSYIAGSLTLNIKAAGKALNTALNGRGGGRDTMIQGKVSAVKSQIIEFVNNISTGEFK